ncbi:MAG: hypothetical protein ACT4RN_00240 [Pseudonocardia sp.]
MDTVLGTARRGHPGLHGLAVAMAGLAVVLVAAALVDDRVLLGAPLWFKPLKFALSFALYGGTLAWMLGRLHTPAMRRTGWLIVIAAAVEMVIIVGQAARGVRSHFNDDTPTDGLLYSIMGATIVVLWLATLAIALRFLREPGTSGSTALAVRLGLGVTLLGMALAFVMASGSGHAVGVPDGGPGLPLVGWSTTGGDLRISHFVGMHALQLLPLLGAALTATRLDETARTRVVLVVGIAYATLVLLLFWQALRAQPLLAPDATTLTALGVVVLGTAAGLVAAVRRPVRSAR